VAVLLELVALVVVLQEFPVRQQVYPITEVELGVMVALVLV
jgi:hypothetical protein